MSHPPKYPRTPYLWSHPSMGTEDRALEPTATFEWFTEPVLVEEKLDGANVTLWQQDGRLRVAPRGGADASDRGRQLGRLRAWVGERTVPLMQATSGGQVLYGEWLWVRHGVAYDALPDWFILLDVWREGEMFPPRERETVAVASDLILPPVRFEGVLGSPERLTRLFGPSAFGAPRAEGLVLRLPDGRRCKVVDPEFSRLRRWDPDVHNRVVDQCPGGERSVHLKRYG